MNESIFSTSWKDNGSKETNSKDLKKLDKLINFHHKNSKDSSIGLNEKRQKDNSITSLNTEKTNQPNKNYKIRYNHLLTEFGKKRKKFLPDRTDYLYEVKSNSKNSNQTYHKNKISNTKLINTLIPLKFLDKQKGEGDLINYNQLTIGGDINKKEPKCILIPQASKLSQFILNKGEEKKNCLIERDIKTFPDNSKEKMKLDFSPNKNIKFRPLSLAYLSVRGPKPDLFMVSKDKKDKGGVVELGPNNNNKRIFRNQRLSEEYLNKNSDEGTFGTYTNINQRGKNISFGNQGKFTIRKAISPYKKNGIIIKKTPYSKKENAAKFIQKWWRRIKLRFIPILNNIIKIQSVWRGYLIRTNVIDLVVLILLWSNFCNRIKNAIRKNILRKIFPCLNKKNFHLSNVMRKILTHIDWKNKINKRKILKKKFKKLKDNNNKIKKSVSAMKIYENRLKCIRLFSLLEKYFHIWILKTKPNNINKKSKETLNKIEGIKEPNKVLKMLINKKSGKEEVINNLQKKLGFNKWNANSKEKEFKAFKQKYINLTIRKILIRHNLTKSLIYYFILWRNKCERYLKQNFSIITDNNNSQKEKIPSIKIELKKDKNYFELKGKLPQLQNSQKNEKEIPILSQEGKLSKNKAKGLMVSNLSYKILASKQLIEKYFKKWKNKINKIKKKKNQKLKSIISVNGTLSAKANLSKYFLMWKYKKSAILKGKKINKKDQYTNTINDIISLNEREKIGNLDQLANALKAADIINKIIKNNLLKKPFQTLLHNLKKHKTLQNNISSKGKKEEINKDISLLKYFYRWMCNSSLIQNEALESIIKQKQKSFSSKNLYNIFKKNRTFNTELKHNLRKWHLISKIIKDRIIKGIKCIIRLFRRKGIQCLKKNHLYYNLLKKLVKYLKKSDLKLLRKAFKKWNQATQRVISSNLKGNILKSIKTQQNRKINKLFLYQYFYKWKQFSPLSKEMEKMQMKKKLIKKICKVINNNPFMRLIQKIKKYKIFPKEMKNIIDKIDNNDNRIKSNYFYLWRSKTKKINDLISKLHNMFLKCLNTKKNIISLKNQKLKEVSKIMKHVYNERSKKLKAISDFLKGIIFSGKNSKVLKRNIFLRNKLHQIIHNNNNNLSWKLMTWKRIIENLIANDYSNIIKKYLKKRKQQISNKKDFYKKLMNLLYNKILSKCLNDLKEKCSKLKPKNIINYRNKILQKIINGIDSKNEQILRNKFNQLNNNTTNTKRIQSIFKIQSLYRKLQSIKKLEILLNIQKLLRNRVLNLSDKYQKLLESYLNKWQREVKNLISNEHANIIQKYLHCKLKVINKSKAQTLLKHCAIKKIINILDTIAHSQVQNKINKLNKLCEVLHAMSIKKPKIHLIKGMKTIMKIRILKKIIRKIPNIIKEYFILPTIQKWRNKTAKAQEEKILIIQKWTRRYLKYIHKQRTIDLDEFFRKYLHKLQNDREMLIIIGIRKWRRKSNLMIFISPANKIQKIAKGYLFRNGKRYQKIKEPLIQKRKKLLDKAKKILDIIQKDDNPLNYYWKVYHRKTTKTPKEKIMDFLHKKLNILNSLNQQDLLYWIRRWNKITKGIRFDNDAKIIQHFMHKLFKKILRLKLKKILGKYKEKKLIESILNAAKTLRINKVGMKRLFKKFIQRCLRIQNKFALLKNIFSSYNYYDDNILKVKFAQYNAIIIQMKSAENANIIKTYINQKIKQRNNKRANKKERFKQIVEKMGKLENIIQNKNKKKVLNNLILNKRIKSLLNCFKCIEKANKRLHYGKYRKKIRYKKLKEVLLHEIAKQPKIKLSYFRKLNSIVKALNIIDHVRTIHTFVLEYYNYRRIYKKWQIIARLLENILTARLMKYLRKFCKLKKLTDNIQKRFKLYAFTKLKLNQRIKILLDITQKKLLRKAFNKWMINNKKLDRRNNFSSCLSQIAENTSNIKERKYLSKFYKLYIYLIICKLFNMIHLKQRSYKQSSFISIKNIIQTKQLSLPIVSNKTHNPRTINFFFSKKCRSGRGTVIKGAEKLPTYYLLLPPFILYLNQKIIKKKKEFLKALQVIKLGSELSNAFKTSVNKIILKQKEKFVKKLLFEANFSLMRLVSRQITNNIIDKIKQVKGAYNLFYILKMTIMFKKLAHLKWLSYILRSWRFISTYNKFKVKRLEKLYKNFSLTYLNMANDIFGGQTDNPNLQNEMKEMLGKFP